MDAGSNLRSVRSSRSARLASSIWYDSTRVTPTPEIAASMAASAVLTMSRE
jgi:hypothetical protein